MQSVREGVNLNSRVAEIFASIAEGVDGASEAVAEIVQAAEEQRHGLAGQARSLEEMVGQFELAGGDTEQRPCICGVRYEAGGGDVGRPFVLRFWQTG